MATMDPLRPEPLPTSSHHVGSIASTPADERMNLLFAALNAKFDIPSTNNEIRIKDIQYALDAIFPKISSFRKLSDEISKLDPTTSKAEIQEIYSQAIEQFEKIRFLDTPQAWVQRADLLDVIDSIQAWINKAVRDNGRTEFELKDFPSPEFKIDPNQSKKPWKEATVPIIPYNNIDDINRLGVNALHSLHKSNIHGVQQELGDKVVGEHTSTAKYVRIFAKATRFAWFLDVIYRILTSLAGKKNMQVVTTLDIATTAKNLGISSIEAVYTKSVDDVGTMRMHGPKFLFGTSVWDYESVNAFFTRDLSDEARTKYLAKTQNEIEELTRKYYHNETKVSLLAISNADAQVRITPLEPDDIKTSRKLTGKVLSNEAAKEAQKAGDNPAYYTEAYRFNMNELVGRFRNDTLQPRPVEGTAIFKKLQDFTEASQDLGEAEEPLELDEKLRKVNELKNTILKNKNVQKDINFAQHELLGGALRDYFQKEGAVEVIQRLATFNVHNYTSSVSGTPMSHQEVAVWLKQVQEQTLLDLARLDQLNDKTRDELEKKIVHFEMIRKIFKAQETLLGRQSQSTIDIYGTNQSVSTPAIQHQPNILAQNDRKVMFFMHEDGHVSMHVFIGATGVNRVDVDPEIKQRKQGARVGDMGFGPDTYEEDENKKLKAATATTTRDALPKLRMGEHLGAFPINGSTVVSYYIPTDFVPKTNLMLFKDRAKYQNGEENIEIKAQMGDSLLIKTELALMEFLQKYAGFKPMTGHSLLEMINSLPDRGIVEGQLIDAGENEKAHILKLYDMLIKFKTPDRLSNTESCLMKQVQGICERRERVDIPVWKNHVDLNPELLHIESKNARRLVDSTFATQPPPPQGRESKAANFLRLGDGLSPVKLNNDISVPGQFFTDVNRVDLYFNKELIEGRVIKDQKKLDKDHSTQQSNAVCANLIEKLQKEFRDEYNPHIFTNIATFFNQNVFDLEAQLQIIRAHNLDARGINKIFTIDNQQDPIKFIITMDLEISKIDPELDKVVLATKKLTRTISIPYSVLKNYDWEDPETPPDPLDAITVIDS